MATAEELLTTMAASEVEEHIVIGRDRVVTVPSALKAIAVQHDHNIETVTFDCPRYWDGHDFSKMNIYVNYRTAGNTTGRYPVDNPRIDEHDKNIIHFDWVISSNVTFKSGKISFLVCVYTTDSDGIETRHWNSRLNQDMEILEGLETSNEDAAYENPDIIETMLVRLNTIENNAGGYSLHDIANLRIWSKYYGSNGIARTYNEKCLILYKNSSSEFPGIDYGDNITRSGDNLVLVNATTIEKPDVNTLKNVVRGKYIRSHSTNLFTYIPKDASIYQSGYSTVGTSIYAVPAYEITIGTGFINYVASLDPDAYPVDAEDEDGFHYVYQKQLADCVDTTDQTSKIAAVIDNNVLMVEVVK